MTDLLPACSTTERRASKRAQALVHRRRVAEALAPDPRQWHYDGETYYIQPPGAMGSCACGHAIRQVFVLRGPGGRIVRIGSVCIESTVPYLLEYGADALATALQSALAAVEAERAKADRAARDAAADAAVQAILADCEALESWALSTARAMRESRRWLPYPLYRGIRVRRTACTTPGRTKAALQRRYQSEREAAVAAWRDMQDMPAPPSPTFQG